MLTTIYSLGFIWSVLALVAWLYFQAKGPWYSRMRWLVLGGLAAYFYAMYFADLQTGYKFSLISRDLLTIAGIGLIFQLVRKSPGSFLIGFIALCIGLSFYKTNVLQTSFEGPYVESVIPPTETATATVAEIELDKEGELLVELEQGRTMGALEQLTDQYDLTYQRAFFPERSTQTDLDDYFVVNVPDRYLGNLEEIKEKLYESGLVDWVEENEVVQVSPITPARPNPGTKEKFGINDPGIEQLWAFDAMEMNKLYEVLQKQKITVKEKAVIAILDTGVDAKHEDLSDNFTSLQSKYDNDPKGHGTHCAGIAAAVSNNGLGVASFSQGNEFVAVTSIKVLNGMGMGTQKMIVGGIIEAADKGAAVISLSLGGRSTTISQKAYSKAVKYANKAGAIVIAAAGNSNRNAKDFSPVNAEGIIGVAAIDENLNRAVFSNFVQDIKMGIAAPGVNIYSTIPGDKYATFNGTSMATPYVAGLVGLMKSIRPSLTTKEVHTILTKTGVDTKNPKETGRFIQPAQAVEKLLK